MKSDIIMFSFLAIKLCYLILFTTCVKNGIDMVVKQDEERIGTNNYYYMKLVQRFVYWLKEEIIMAIYFFVQVSPCNAHRPCYAPFVAF